MKKILQAFGFGVLFCVAGFVCLSAVGAVYMGVSDYKCEQEQIAAGMTKDEAIRFCEW